MSTTKPEKTTLPLDRIQTDGGTQPRDGLLEHEVADYAEQLRAGATFPPVEVVFDGADYWLTDGFQRVEAHKRAELTEIAAYVQQGTREDAVWLSLGANRDKHRYASERQQVVLAALTHPASQQMTTRAIAAHIGISQESLKRWQKQFQEQGVLPEEDPEPEPAAASADSPPPAPSDLGDDDDPSIADSRNPIAETSADQAAASPEVSANDYRLSALEKPEPVFTPTLPTDLLDAGWELHQTGDTEWQAVNPDLDMHTQPTSDPVALIDDARQLAASVGMAPPPDDDEDDEPEPVAEPEAAAPPADYTAGGQPVSGEAAVGTVASFVQMLYTVASERWEAVSLSEQEPDEVYPVDYDLATAHAALLLDSFAFQSTMLAVLTPEPTTDTPPA